MGRNKTYKCPVPMQPYGHNESVVFHFVSTRGENGISTPYDNDGHNKSAHKSAQYFCNKRENGISTPYDNDGYNKSAQYFATRGKNEFLLLTTMMVTTNLHNILQQEGKTNFYSLRQ
ncbi:hypothetical protein CEXT_720581 [Caerostris extrusa]|uniref:Uncharacterized protein n=1 Tax=Caerostris extrusa TaxID=172846 RepID=A0AAV4N1C5_CAEEX|nr:hypothetical protein CEXT_720581 [Caerostris extrusa]